MMIHQAQVISAKHPYDFLYNRSITSVVFPSRAGKVGVVREIQIRNALLLYELKVKRGNRILLDKRVLILPVQAD
jgi:hypothetical protein